MLRRPARLARSARLGLPALALLGVGLAGCGEPAPAEPAAPVPGPSSSAPATPSPAPQQGGVSADTGSTGSDGLTVRYLDGTTVRTVRVEDFPR